MLVVNAVNGTRRQMKSSIRLGRWMKTQAAAIDCHVIRFFWGFSIRFNRDFVIDSIL